MRRIQIYLNEPTDDALSLEATRRGMSKAAVIRAALDKELGRAEAGAEDSLSGLIGLFSDGGVDDIDEYLYGPSADA